MDGELASALGLHIRRLLDRSLGIEGWTNLKQMSYESNIESTGSPKIQFFGSSMSLESAGTKCRKKGRKMI